MTALASLAALAIATAPCTLPPLAADGPPWHTGESLSWDVDLLGLVKAGTLSVTVDRPMFDGSVIPLRARASNTSVLAKVRRFRGVAHSWVDARTLRPQRYRDEADDNGLHRTTDARLDTRGPKVVVAWSAGDQKGTKEFERRGEVMDLLSTVYYLRAANLEPDRQFCFDVLANRRYWRMTVKLAPGTERVQTPGGTFETVRIDAELTRKATSDDSKVRRRTFHVWLSTDAARVPVAAVSEVDLGPVRVQLSRGATPASAAQP